jgi:hypothetical protein
MEGQTASVWRQKAAQVIARPYVLHPGSSAVFLGSSAARGWADAYPDIELGILWDAVPAAGARQGLAESAGGNGYVDYGLDAVLYETAEEYLVAELKVDGIPPATL